MRLVLETVITHVNAMLVRTLFEFRNVIKQGLGSNSLTIKTEDDVFVVFPFVQMLQDEARLSKYFSYPITPMVQELMKEYINAKKKATRSVSSGAVTSV